MFIQAPILYNVLVIYVGATIPPLGTSKLHNGKHKKFTKIAIFYKIWYYYITQFSEGVRYGEDRFTGAD